MTDPMRPATTPWRSGTLARGGRSRVLFGWSYEDERIELEAFGLPGRVCVIAAAGETAAACAAVGHEVTAVDINPRQLDYCAQRLSGSPATHGLAELGMAAGRSIVAGLVPGWRRTELIRALAASEPADAARYWHDRLDTGAFPALLRSLIGPGGVVLRVLDPDLASSVPRRFDQVIRARLGGGLARHGLRGNRFAWRLLTGTDDPHWRLTTTNRVTLVTADVVEHLEQVPRGHYTGISLSNVLDGAAPGFAAKLRLAAVRALDPDGAIVLRSFADRTDPGLARADASMIWGRVAVIRPGTDADRTWPLPRP